jgi:heparin binding hemagglutinin HbhA
MSQPKTTRIPAPLYAAAGAGEMAFRQLLKLPAYANDLGDKAANNGAGLRQQVITTTTELQKRATAAYRQANERAVKLRKEDLDMDRLRDLAMRQAGQFAVGAQELQERAISLYTLLIERGEKVVGTGVVQAADTVQADMIETEKPIKPETNGHAASNGHGTIGSGETKPIAKKTVAPPKKNTTPNAK